MRIKKLLQHKFGSVALVIILVSVFSFLTRLGLLVYSFKDLTLDVFSVPGIFLIGLFYDLIVGMFFALPIAMYTWLMKDSWFRSKINRGILFIHFLLLLAILLLNICSEIAFWNEFNVRYNFIAVDYLIYTTEVLGNIWESYNIPVIILGVLVFSGALLYLLRGYITAPTLPSMRFLKRSGYFVGFLALACSGYFFVNNGLRKFSKNNLVNELAGNGVYEFGAAFWHNEIDYRLFYPLRDDKECVELVRQKLGIQSKAFTRDGLDVDRWIQSDSTPSDYNVMLISVESLSADYLSRFGNKSNLTPCLDSLIPQGLFFENMYATGTRTVRGLEAISLSIPPTPGQSVVRRPHNENMFSLGSLLGSKGYEVKYVYGGNSFFDNMGYFFSHNGYQVIDQKDIPEEKIHHRTAWGVADEDAFAIALEEADKSAKSGKLFFNHIMTVSNHRPFTYPEGRIDISPKLQIREGAVKYTDFAIQHFIDQCKTRPWFKKTIFVIVADHCAKSAGKVAMPVNNYHIPCLIYNPHIIPASVCSKLCSQIDLAPTLMGILNQSYQSSFLGYDIFKTPASEERTFISTYEGLGFIKKDSLLVLSPVRKIEAFLVDFKTGETSKIHPSKDLEKEAIAWYQAASFLVKKEQLKKTN